MTKDKIKPWWEYVPDGAPTGYYVPSTAFYAPALIKQALDYALPIFYYTTNSSVFIENDANKAFENLIKELQSIGGMKFYTDQRTDHHTVIWPNGAFYFSAWGFTANWVVTDIELNNKLNDIVKRFFKDAPVAGKVFALIPSNGGLTTISLGVAAEPLEPLNYTQEAIQGYNKVVNDLKSISPKGKLFILDGPPGTGKTYLIRALLNDCPELKFLILPADLVSQMGAPELLKGLVNAANSEDIKPIEYTTDKNKSNPLVLILEDADECLTKRDSRNMGSIQSLLNATDGILGASLNLRVICTTNAQIEEFDPAILRPGRLSARVEVGLLDIEQANKIYSRLGGEGIPDWGDEKFLPLSAIYAKVKGKLDTIETTKKPKNKIGFAA